jgi:DNA uptake protein ComE-like DNA-binding protein
VKVSITTGDHTRTSTASAIDLAGSEDNRRTENSKERLVESSSINKSLFVLAQCVEAISKKASRIPYRESKMTRILSLGQNNGLTIMILNLASVRSFHLDTLTSLNFANRTKKVEVRDIENEAIFMGCARPVAVSKTMQRQPLRALTSATHNANVGKASNLASNASSKPKLFSVYSDPAGKSLEAQKVLKEKLASPKRPSDSHGLDHRPAKIPRPSSFVSTKSQAKITQEAIEDMVERKVSEILATRALEQKVTPQPQISEDVKRRLEALEQRIEEHDDDERAEGLSFLLMAKQHRARGEDASALKMYRMAREHFPGNPKLEAKISRLQSKLQENTESEAAATELSLSRETLESRRASKFVDEDTDYAPDPADELYDSEAGTRYRTKIRRSHKSAPAVWIDSSAPPTPRTARLLAVINSRDVGAIQALKGVGAKKAQAIVAALHGGDDHGQEWEEGENGLSVESLLELGAIRGVGPRVVESMRVGLAA